MSVSFGVGRLGDQRQRVRRVHSLHALSLMFLKGSFHAFRLITSDCSPTDPSSDHANIENDTAFLESVSMFPPNVVDLKITELVPCDASTNVVSILIPFLLQLLTQIAVEELHFWAPLASWSLSASGLQSPAQSTK